MPDAVLLDAIGRQRSKARCPAIWWGAPGATREPKVYAALTVTAPPLADPPYVLGGDNTLTPIAPARTPRPGRFTFPVTGGALRVHGLTGTVASAGGLAFTYRSNGPHEDPGGYNVTEFQLVFPPSVNGRSGNRREARLVAARVNDPYVDKVIATLDLHDARRTQHGALVTISHITLKLAYDRGSNPIGGLDGSLKNGSMIGTASLTLTTRSPA
jgi:hypothetical protein